MHNVVHILIFLMVTNAASLALASATPNTYAAQKYASSTNEQKTSLVVGSEQDYPPFATGMTDTTAGGFTVDLWKAVAAEAGLNYSIRVLPFHQVLHEFKGNNIDVLINLAISDERRQFADFSVPHVTVHGAIFTRKGESGIRTEEDLAGKSIIVLKADLAHDYALSKNWGKQLVLVNTSAEGMRLLASGKHDAMLLAKLAGMLTLHETKLTNITVLKTRAGFSQKFAFAVPKGKSELLGKINEGLALTKSNGTYDALYEKWFGIYEAKEVGLRDTLKYVIPVVVLFSGFAGYAFYRRNVERKAAERKYRDLYDHAPDMFLSFEAKSAAIIDCNQTLLNTTGYSREEIIGRSMNELYHQDCAEQVQAAFKTFMSCKEVHGVELELLCKDGRKVEVSMNATAVCDGHGVALHSRTALRDISERKRSEEIIINSNKLLHTIINNAPMRIFWKDINLRYLGCNQLFAEDAGVGCADELIGKDDYQVAWKEQAELYRVDDLRVIESGIPKLSYEEPQTTPEGSQIWLLTSKVPLYNEANQVIGVLGTYEDITGRKLAEEEKLILQQQLQQSQKLESLGVLSGGIAHDFNNILAIIIGYCGLIKMDNKIAEKYIPEIEKAAERAAELCRQMLAYAGRTQLNMIPINMVPLMDEIVTMLKSTLPHNAAIKADLSAKTPFICGDPNQLKQIAMNLINNSSESIGKEQGEIHVSLTTASVSAGQAVNDYNGTSIPAGEYVCLEVADTGCGMDPETIRRIFEPFYTTKFAGRGLGMSAVLGIITAHKGALQLYSKPGRGTNVKIFFPILKEGSIEEGLLLKGPAAPWRGCGTILLVEDDEQILKITSTLLEEMGFSVIESANGREAIEQYRNNPANISLVITDMGMPVMDGYELFRELKKINPKLKIIVSSGFGDAEITSRIPPKEITGLISKPYNYDQLREALKSVVDGAGTEIMGM